MFICLFDHPRCSSTHQCKQVASPSSSLEQPICTRTFHLGFVGNFGRWDTLPYHHQHYLDTPHPGCPSTPVGLVGHTTLLRWAWVLWVADTPLYHCPQWSMSQLHSSQWGVSRHAAGQLQKLQRDTMLRGTSGHVKGGSGWGRNGQFVSLDRVLILTSTWFSKLPEEQYGDKATLSSS